MSRILIHLAEPNEGNKRQSRKVTYTHFSETSNVNKQKMENNFYGHEKGWFFVSLKKENWGGGLAYVEGMRGEKLPL